MKDRKHDIPDGDAAVWSAIRRADEAYEDALAGRPALFVRPEGVPMDTAHEQNHETIAARAYAIYLERERQGIAGDELSDWYTAEQEILAKEAPAPRRKTRGGH